MTLLSATFLYNRTRGQIELLRQDGYGPLAALRGIIKSGFGKGGIGRNVIKPWAQFLKPGFHPWDIDDRALITQGEDRLAAAQKQNEKYAQPAERRKLLRFAKAA